MEHRDKVIPLAIVALLGIFMVVFSATQLGGPADITGQMTVGSCVDTDAIEVTDYLVKGVTRGLNGNPYSSSSQFIERTDECTPNAFSTSEHDRYFLTEYSCVNDIVTSTEINCALIPQSQGETIYTCEDGACVISEEIPSEGVGPDPHLEWDSLTPKEYRVGNSTLGTSFTVLEDPGDGALTMKWADIISAAAPVGLVYKYFSVETTLTSYDLTDSPTLYFEVPDDWMLDNIIASSQIELQRLSYGVWTPLLVTEAPKLQQTSLTGTYFTATTPGFSYFAVTAPAPVVNDTPIVLQGPECGDGTVDYNEECEEGDETTCADYLGNPSCTGLVSCSYCNWDSYDCYCACDTSTQPQPEGWSECTEGEQTRTVYACDTSSGEWEASSEDQDCSESNLMWILIIVGVVVVVGGGIFALFFYFRSKGGAVPAQPTLKPAKPQV